MESTINEEVLHTLFMKEILLEKSKKLNSFTPCAGKFSVADMNIPGTSGAWVDATNPIFDITAEVSPVTVSPKKISSSESSENANAVGDPVTDIPKKILTSESSENANAVGDPVTDIPKKILTSESSENANAVGDPVTDIPKKILTSESSENANAVGDPVTDIPKKILTSESSENANAVGDPVTDIPKKILTSESSENTNVCTDSDKQTTEAIEQKRLQFAQKSVELNRLYDEIAVMEKRNEELNVRLNWIEGQLEEYTTDINSLSKIMSNQITSLLQNFPTDVDHKVREKYINDLFTFCMTILQKE